MHNSKHPLAGKKVNVIPEFSHRQYPNMDHLIIEDWWDHLTGGSWKDAVGNPGCLVYAIRAATSGYNVPNDDEVVYGKYKGMGVLVHVSEIEEYEKLIDQVKQE